MHVMIEKIGWLDFILIIILCISLIAKFVREFVVYVQWKQWSNQDRKDNKQCVFLLEQKGKFDCENNLYRKKYFSGGRCNREKCGGYRTGRKNNQDYIYTKAIYTITYIGIDWISQLSTVILIIRTLINISE